MNKLNWAKFSKDLQSSVSRHAPEILTGLGITGVIATVGLAIKATPKALELLEERKREEHVDELSALEVVKTTWKCYVPMAITGAFSIACIAGASSVHTRRHAALAAAYELSKTAITEYSDAVKKDGGEKKERAIRDKINLKQIEKHPVDADQIIETGNGTSLCLDPLGGRYFTGDIEKIRRAENAINSRMLHSICGSASLNEFYDEIGLDYTELGEVLGWNAENLIKLHITAGLTHDERPCLVIGHYNAPVYDF